MKKVLLAISLIFLAGAGCEIKKQAQQPIQGGEASVVEEVTQPAAIEEVAVNTNVEKVVPAVSAVNTNTNVNTKINSNANIKPVNNTGHWRSTEKVQLRTYATGETTLYCDPGKIATEDGLCITYEEASEVCMSLYGINYTWVLKEPGPGIECFKCEDGKINIDSACKIPGSNTGINTNITITTPTPTAVPAPQAISNCPDGYQWNADKTKCITLDEACKIKYGDNIYSTGINASGSNICNCSAGYLWNNDKTQCITRTAYCSNIYGSYSYFSGKLNADGGWSCSCMNNYTWNVSKTKCISYDDACKEKFGSDYYAVINAAGTIGCANTASTPSSGSSDAELCTKALEGLKQYYSGTGDFSAKFLASKSYYENMASRYCPGYSAPSTMDCTSYLGGTRCTFSNGSTITCTPYFGGTRCQ
ncbi:MAG: hypothetical protein WCV92_05175 [Candidatus Buchananbacteria bacterium]